MKLYLWRILVAIDQLINTLIGGKPDETLSASAYYGEMRGKPLASFFRPIIDFIFYPLEKEHCKAAYESELADARRRMTTGEL